MSPMGGERTFGWQGLRPVIADVDAGVSPDTLEPIVGASSSAIALQSVGNDHELETAILAGIAACFGYLTVTIRRRSSGRSPLLCSELCSLPLDVPRREPGWALTGRDRGSQERVGTGFQLFAGT